MEWVVLYNVASSFHSCLSSEQDEAVKPARVVDKIIEGPGTTSAIANASIEPVLVRVDARAVSGRLADIGFQGIHK
jgi:hypothetical protein